MLENPRERSSFDMDLAQVATVGGKHEWRRTCLSCGECKVHVAHCNLQSAMHFADISLCARNGILKLK